jgi:hypothetical protein
MKKLLTLAMLGGLFAATTLQAQVNIYISGSTAFRSNAYRAITNLYGANLTGQNPGGVGANDSGSSQVTLQGTIPSLYSTQTVTIYLSWNGSVQGTHNLVNNDNISFLTNDFSILSDTNLITHTPDLAFSDVFQITTPFNATALVDTNVAVQPFCWARGVNASTNITDITMQQIQECWSVGTMELSYFTGKSSDDTTNVYFTGRNKDSGSRLTVASDVFVSGTPSIFANTNGIWFKMATNTIANNVSYGPGFSSGSQEALALTAPANGGGLGYLGYSDARTVVTGGGQIINYNGALPFNGYSANVPLVGNGAQLSNTPDFTPIIKGQYSLWAYEHLFMRSGLTGNIPAFYAAVVPAIDSDIATATPVTAIRLSQMLVARPADGGTIHP